MSMTLIKVVVSGRSSAPSPILSLTTVPPLPHNFTLCLITAISFVQIVLCGFVPRNASAFSVQGIWRGANVKVATKSSENHFSHFVPAFISVKKHLPFSAMFALVAGTFVLFQGCSSLFHFLTLLIHKLFELHNHLILWRSGLEG